MEKVRKAEVPPPSKFNRRVARGARRDRAQGAGARPARSLPDAPRSSPTISTRCRRAVPLQSEGDAAVHAPAPSDRSGSRQSGACDGGELARPTGSDPRHRARGQRYIVSARATTSPRSSTRSTSGTRTRRHRASTTITRARRDRSPCSRARTSRVSRRTASCATARSCSAAPSSTAPRRINPTSTRRTVTRTTSRAWAARSPRATTCTSARRGPPLAPVHARDPGLHDLRRALVVEVLPVIRRAVEPAHAGSGQHARREQPAVDAQPILVAAVRRAATSASCSRSSRSGGSRSSCRPSDRSRSRP